MAAYKLTWASGMARTARSCRFQLHARVPGLQDLLRVGRAWRGDSELIFGQLWHGRQDADIGKGWGKKRTH
jgi:hypothetical protein